jgi:PAS domain S-box-containing protein
MEQTADGIMILDGATHTILDVNETFCRWLDYTRDELKGQTTEHIVCPHPRMNWEARLAEVHRLGHPADPNAAPQMMEVEYRRRDGAGVPREVDFQYVAVQGRELVVVVARDVSERRRLELQLHHAQKMESIGRLAGGIAHDFNNVLTAIIGYTGMARAALPADHAAVADLEEVHRSAERASALTRQLLAFARKQIIQPQLVSANQLLHGVEPMLKPLIGEDVVLKVHTATDVWLVNVDPSQFQQIVLNLAVNARDAMPSGGMLTFETANVVLGAEYARHHPDVAPGEYVRLAVTDTGIGMDEQVQQHIFEPFFTTKGTGHGTGLGLATTHGIVRQSGGHIWLYSEPGRGTTFKIYLPRATDGVAPVSRVESPAARGGWETVLVVEDEAMVRHFAAIALERLGYRAVEAADGETALEIASALGGPIHLLFTDVVMPRMNGHELAARIREQWPELRVLYTSGYTDNTIVHQGVLDPGLAFLQKPYTAAELSAKVRDVLDAPVELLT